MWLHFQKILHVHSFVIARIRRQPSEERKAEMGVHRIMRLPSEERKAEMGVTKDQWKKRTGKIMTWITKMTPRKYSFSQAVQARNDKDI